MNEQKQMSYYSEKRNGDVFEIAIIDVDKDHASVSIRINGILISNKKYQKKSFNLDNFFFKEVGKIHLGFYDGHVRK